MSKRSLLLSVLLLRILACDAAGPEDPVSLNGAWEYGLDRLYEGTTEVPGIPLDPAKIAAQKLWYRRTVVLPQGDWTRALLELKGARFLPEVYVDGELVSSQPGGMTRTFHPLTHRNVRPGRKVTLEIALAPLGAVPPADASYIPPADQWRSNVSSCLWDDVVIRFDAGSRITRVIPRIDRDAETVTLDYTIEGTALPTTVTWTVSDLSGRPLITGTGPYDPSQSLSFSYGGILREWSPESPELYRLELKIASRGKTLDATGQILGIKVFSVRDKKFLLNGKPCTLRGGTVVWHRWVRDPEGRDAGYDTLWFRDNIVMRIKEHGGNYLRFHLGVPPERLLDLCDRYGLLVQYEWSFFHGMPASYESLMQQYPEWFDFAQKHPCVALYHPYNETEGEQLRTAWQALDSIVKNYPPLVLAERDVVHIHKYWWSLFENLGLYYDSAEQFDKAIMVDEFGGNYLDGYGELGGYKSLRESYLRFLGRNSTPEMRLRHLAQSNGRVAEYWRRIGAAGVAPFTIASSWEDGNTWFLGPLREGRPKTVWNALTAAWSPVSASLDLWDRNFTPGQRAVIPLYLFNETDRERLLQVEVTIRDSFEKRFFTKHIPEQLAPRSVKTVPVEVVLPDREGEFLIGATVLNTPEGVKYPVVSEWDVRTFRARISGSLKNTPIYIPPYEVELLTLARNFGMKLTAEPENASIVLLGRKSWETIASGDRRTGESTGGWIAGGRSVLMLDVGERYLGQGYPEVDGDPGPLQGVARVTDPRIVRYGIFDGFALQFTETAEPESHLHPTPENSTLWKDMPLHYTWLWNGMRGGLLAPAADMEVVGMARDAFIEQWKARGADVGQILSGSDYYTYELYGFYEFADHANDRGLNSRLREKVEFLVADAPALAGSINPLTPVTVTDLSAGYRSSEHGMAQRLIPLANAGKNLTRTPVILIDFGAGKGRMILSQLLTAGRLAPGYGENSPYGIRYDETAVQLVLNMMDELRTQQ